MTGKIKKAARTKRKKANHALRVLIAPDKFKGTLTSEQAARAIAKGMRRACPPARETCVSLTDGGEGFMELMVRQTKGRMRSIRTVDAAMRPCRAKWGVLGNGRTAVIGLTEASGIARLPTDLHNPELTTNAGTAKMIRAALREGYKEILIGLGGSATNDGGISLAAAAGYLFLDDAGNEIPLNGLGLASLARIVPPHTLPEARFIVATDVDHPLYGRGGAAYHFGPQKGADGAMVKRLDVGLRRLARIVERDLGCDRAGKHGAGAAGGCGYGLMVFFRARREKGFELVRRITNLDGLIRQHDLVITGEGCFDRTSLLGKAPCQLGKLCRRWKKPVWALCGRCSLPLAKSPFDRMFALSTKASPDRAHGSLSAAQHGAKLEQLSYDIFRGNDRLPGK